MSNSKNDAATGRPRRFGYLFKAVALVAVAGWLAAGGLMADRMHDKNLTSSLNVALVRSHSERHALTLELERVTAELQSLQQRLETYSDRGEQAQAAF
jgi:hypothetical protein